MMWRSRGCQNYERGGRILMGRELVALAYDEVQKFWRIGVATADGKRENYTARHVVSSAPVRELVQKLSPKPISLLHARALRYRDFLTGCADGSTSRICLPTTGSIFTTPV